jgi:hypothetical protein
MLELDVIANGYRAINEQLHDPHRRSVHNSLLGAISRSLTFSLYPSCAAGAQSPALRVSVPAQRTISSITFLQPVGLNPPRVGAPLAYSIGGRAQIEGGSLRSWPDCARQGMAADAWLAITDHSGLAPEAQALMLDSAGILSLTVFIRPSKPTASAV